MQYASEGVKDQKLEVERKKKRKKKSKKKSRACLNTYVDFCSILTLVSLKISN